MTTRRTRRWGAAPTLGAAMAAFAMSCTSTGGIQPRFTAVHNTLASLNIAQLGSLSEGSLSEGGRVQFPLELQARCYTFVGFGGDGARDVDLWSTIAMHPAEFLAIVAFVPLALLIAPVHVASLLAVCTFLGASIAFAHSGFEFGADTDRALLRALYLMPRIHASHHVHRSCNFAAITTVFDRALGTLRA